MPLMYLNATRHKTSKQSIQIVTCKIYFFRKNCCYYNWNNDGLSMTEKRKGVICIKHQRISIVISVLQVCIGLHNDHINILLLQFVTQSFMFLLRMCDRNSIIIQQSYLITRTAR